MEANIAPDFWFLMYACSYCSCITIQYTLPEEHVFSEASLQPTATKILELIFDLSLEENPILFHVFSNAGGILYKNIIDVLHSEPQFGKLCVAGTIFDSAPACVNPSSGAKALMASQPNVNIFVRYLLALVFLLNFSAVWLYGKVLSFFRPTYQAPHSDYWNSMKNDPSRWPQMYLFSRNDQIVPDTGIREITKHRRSLGVEVQEQCWDDSDHVMHFRLHPESYKKECSYFLDLCLSRL